MARDIGALTFVGSSIEAYSVGLSVFTTVCGGVGNVAEEQLAAAQAWDLGAGVTTQSLSELRGGNGQDEDIGAHLPPPHGYSWCARHTV